MILEKILAFKTELLSFSARERIFIFSAMLCGFLISADYAIIRPVSNSLFIHSYTSQWFPYAWLATVPLNFLAVSLYNRYLPKLGCFKMFLSIICLIMFGNLFCALFLTKLAWLPFLFYIWKEVYILLMLQQLWSVVHTTIPAQRAKYLYGILFGVGALGGVAGSILPGFFAVLVGSENLLFATLPIYLLLLGAYQLLVKNSAITAGEERAGVVQNNSLDAFRHGVKLIATSKFLIFILLIVSLMQISACLVDYQFNTVLEKMVLQKDLRTQYTARILGIVHCATITLQFVGSFLLVHFLGMRRSHFLIPAILCLNSIGFLLFPAFGMISFAYITIKCFDFSIFNVIKEMLYIPLKLDEKFRAKALIDVFAYRTAKALASFLILFLQAFLSVRIVTVLTWSSVAIFTLWCFLVFRMLRNYSPQTSTVSKTF